jgi:hypothetical protein
VIISQSVVIGRGGGGHGGGFGRGGFDRGDFSHGDFDRNFDHFGSDLNDMHGYARPDTLEHTPAAAEDRTYNWGNHGLSTDNGLSRPNTAMTSSEQGRYTPAQMAVNADAVRHAYDYPGTFNSGWWAAHPNAWHYGAWGNDWAWGGTGWGTMAGFWGVPETIAPVPYDYGNNITYQNNTVYYGSQPMESAIAYYQQAQTLAQSAPIKAEKTAASAKNWKPLGVYSLVQGGQSSTDMMFQLAVNKEGAIKGNYYNALTDETKPVTGAVDKKSMRAAWIVGNNKNVVYDTGVSNLLKDQSPILLHLNKDKTQQWTLVRLHQQNKEA